MLSNPQFLIHTYLSCLYCFAELKENVRELEEWFKEAESILREPLKFNQKWTRKAIDAKMEEIQVSESKFSLFKVLYFKCVQNLQVHK